MNMHQVTRARQELANNCYKCLAPGLRISSNLNVSKPALY